ncbi:LysM peptidoglycan-binding domain-containing protein [Beggiatoa leptomitoformis]|uniref:LysM peptidoglycan-binding domain-containing protein n=1 Tax=Beggiatoa leptomitoformis TaxID=288004 RepID=A0A2N9YHR6_9GAMM|nr:LysM peptidoglycan-binding domain-containing protein [Beggiatoa leptomitoformis]ALG67736.2 LysM peptidoglycan-binding domain-containing protein [Beggiatoa leptomitoformis]AUI70024.2 LysM peptidoglycan-binding domain-containing protein [Beggiatoa leptomitoformis]
MYRTLISARRWTVLGLVMTAFISGCSTVETTEPTPTDTDNGGYSGEYPTDITIPDNGNESPPADGSYYTVVAGDSLYAIARRYNMDWRAIASSNGIVPPYNLSVGQQLIINGSSSPSYDSGAVTAPVKSVPTPQPQPTTPDYNNYPSVSSGNVHVVQRGESLYGIARLYNVDFRNIAAWNNIPAPYAISVGQQLNLSPAGTTGSTTAAVPVSSSRNYATSENTHVVQAGETLYSISKRYGASVQQVASWNNIPQPYTLSVGQQLTVGTGGAVTKASVATRSYSRSTEQYHTVAKGDTLYNIATRYGFTPLDVAAWNNIAPPYNIMLGQRLIVSPPAASSYTGDMTSQSYTGNTSSTLKTQSVTNNSRNFSQAYSYHVVAQGETLGSIAERYGLTRQELALWNGIGSPYTVYPGQRLMIIPPN